MSMRSILLAAALCLSAAHAQAQQSSSSSDALRFLNRLAAQYLVLFTRSFIDTTYDTVTVEPGTNDLIITGLRLYPEFEWDEAGACEITIDRLVAADVTSFETLQTLIELSGLAVPLTCLDPIQGGLVASFGYEQLAAERMSIDITYDLPSAAADLVIQASIVDAGELSVTAAFDYLWFRMPSQPGEQPEPVALLGEAEISFDNAGVWEKLEPMLGAQLGDLSTAPQMVELMLTQILSEGGVRQPGTDELSFVQNLSGEVGRFLDEKNRIVVTAAPDQGVWLGPDMFGSASEAILALRPEVSAIPLAQRQIVKPDELLEALSGGAGLDDAARLRIGRALLTGVGAPRSLVEGRALLAPLANDWNPEAALLLADTAAEDGDRQGAYALALRALAGGATGAGALADELETTLPLADILAAQEDAGQTWSGTDDTVAASDEAIAAGDITALRTLAYRAASGQGMPRNARAAYFWASLAAAAGDRGAAGLRTRLDNRFGARDRETWRPVAAQAAAQALATWTDGGLGARIVDGIK